MKISSFEQRLAGMDRKLIVEQLSSQFFAVMVWPLGQSVPIEYRHGSVEAAQSHAASILTIWRAEDTHSCMAELQARNDALHKLCVAAQDWLDAAGHTAPEHLKSAIQRNADAFRKALETITP